MAKHALATAVLFGNSNADVNFRSRAVVILIVIRSFPRQLAVRFGRVSSFAFVGVLLPLLISSLKEIVVGPCIAITRFEISAFITFHQSRRVCLNWCTPERQRVKATLLRVENVALIWHQALCWRRKKHELDCAAEAQDVKSIPPPRSLHQISLMWCASAAKMDLRFAMLPQRRSQQTYKGNACAETLRTFDAWCNLMNSTARCQRLSSTGF